MLSSVSDYDLDTYIIYYILPPPPAYSDADEEGYLYAGRQRL